MLVNRLKPLYHKHVFHVARYNVTTVTTTHLRQFPHDATFLSGENAPLNEKNNGIEMTVAFQPTDVRKDKIEIYLHGKNQVPKHHPYSPRDDGMIQRLRGDEYVWMLKWSRYAFVFGMIKSVGNTLGLFSLS